jgi:nitroreductase
MSMDVHEAINIRRSVRSYDAKRAIPPEVMERLRAALRLAPSACNFQPWHFILVTDPKLRHDLSKIANDQHFIADAALIVVACGLPLQAHKRMAGHRNSVEVDVAIALDHLTLAAVAEGLGTCWIGAFDEQKAKRLLEVPDELEIVALMPVGYPASPDLNHPLDESRRKAEGEIFSTDKYGRR